MRSERIRRFSVVVLSLGLGCGGGGDPKPAPAPDDAGARPVDAVDAAMDAGGEGETRDGGPADLVPAGGIPPGWSLADVGAVAARGSSGAAAGFYFLSGGGADIGGHADAFHFLFQRVTGDHVLIAHLSRLISDNPAAKAGLMVRASPAPDAPHAALLVTGDNKLLLQRRAVAGGEAETQELPAAGAWLKLGRTGNTLTASTSADGNEWIEAGSVEVTQPETLSLGLVVAGPGTGVFHAVRLSAHVPPWTESDVGDVGLPGGSRFLGNSFLLSGSGSDLAGPNDQFTFLHRVLPGDGEVSVRVAAFNFADPLSKVGVMFRADLSPGAPYLSVVLSPVGNQVLRRGTPGDRSLVVRAQSSLPARWLRLTRIGQQLVCHVSEDGLRWTVAYTEVPLPDAAPLPALPEVGLMVSARNNTRIATAVLDNIVVRSYPPYPADLVDGGASDGPDAGVDAPATVPGGVDAAPDLVVLSPSP